MIEVGKKIPPKLKGILVQGDKSKEIPIKELYQKGPIVLYFYPKDDTPGCTTEACSIRDGMPSFKKFSLPVFGCSRDPVKAHEKFIAKHGLNFPLISDESGEITEAFGVWAEKSMYGRKYMGIIRSTFLIDSSGKILLVFDKVSVKTHSADILAAYTAMTEKNDKK